MLGISIEKTPEKGFILACFRERPVFGRYERKSGEIIFEGWEAFREKMPQECHLFDADTEYRMVARQARRDRIELVLTAREEETMEPDLLYTENVLIREEYRQDGTVPETITVINRYQYSADDTLMLKNYRLSAHP